MRQPRPRIPSPTMHGMRHVNTPAPTVEELWQLVRRRELAFRAAAKIGAALVDVAALGDGVQEAKARHRLGLVVEGLDRVADRCVRDLRKARRDPLRGGLPAELAALIDELPGGVR